MKIFKKQFEIRYTPILDFSQMYRSLISPYLRLTADFAIQNQNSLDEYVVLKFRSENYHIDCRWDKIIFLSEGNRDDLLKPQGPIFMFFEIFNKISIGPTFGKVVNAVLASHSLIESKYSNEEIVTRFKEKFFQPGVAFQIAGLKTDMGVALEFTNDSTIFKLRYGPFDYKKDVKDFNLNPHSLKAIDSYKDDKGIIVEALYYQEISKVNFETFRNFDQYINSYTSRITL